MAAAAARELKRAARKLLKARLHAVPAEARAEQSAAAAAAVLRRPEYAAASSVAVYLSMSDEVDTARIITKIFDDGKRCYVPRFEGELMDMWTVRSEKDIADLPRGKWDIAQPEGDLETRESALTAPELVDLILVPGLGFTAGGARLGRGKGYYDRFLAKATARAAELGRPKPMTIGIGFVEQRLDEVPVDEFDITLDAVVFSDDQ
mmetsp:Transcript_3166/g.7664  ORF Transcript_3166/g.7664 Transcript_3166/m.7664 type:complete len:206 (-) Transcript_3166:413-1030(-)|eukprot:CAMPEP_0182928856 /NCGR_PEP_ID=MMETSP0105_2-20130417/17893_1 /TAXON_ID=81532 ORGANISM="Acanthoeca-like sp., Strain 10tr" /NCGR_SAMPLE_ID=MMETSP0105_2 /ASSEMBLY_ACC=CAM_ASM_000205 /LENGTH=205 /DNA_ID=CAMNT_0025066909 /DNA_START=252 /DNA_END=869 /DNA_ORIENTATION=-